MKRLVSIVIPFFNEEGSLGILYERLIEVLGNGDDNYEIVFVDDGSVDGSLAIVKSIAASDPHVHLIVLRKNFGKAAALRAGFHYSQGEIVITMDADLQDEPAEISNFISKIDEGYDLVSGWKKDRKDPLEKRLPSKLFNKVTSKMSGVKLHDFNCGFKAYRREVVSSIDIYGELHRYIPVLAHRKGFKIAEIAVAHHKRSFGKSKYGMERYLRGLFDSMSVSFLAKFYDRPMYFFGRIGLMLFLIGFVICAILTIEWLKGIPIGSRPLLALGILLITLGVQSFSIGLIGDMLVDATYRNRRDESNIRERI